MPTYLMLSSLTEKGTQTLNANPARLREVNQDVEELGARILHQWASLGEYDFVSVVEAPDDLTIANMSVRLGARGSVRFETLPLVAGRRPPRSARGVAPRARPDGQARPGLEPPSAAYARGVGRRARPLDRRDRRPARLDADDRRGDDERPGVVPGLRPHRRALPAEPTTTSRTSS